ncbi:MAG: hypothetical protein PHR51_01740 [Patescibacteria group bacterium]|nr:hypothetical protein [Patescibacteria group bacterium]
MDPKRIISFILAVVSTAGFVLPANFVKAFEQFPRSLAWELVSQSGDTHYDSLGYPYAIHYVQPGETVNMWVTVRNRSRNRQAEMWYGKSALLDEGPNYPNAHAIGLGTWAPMDHVPSFLDPSSFVINGNRFAYYDGSPINKGQTMTLQFQVKIKEGIANGAYDLTTSFVREFDEWGWRDNGKGQNHHYRSMLWKFVVGGSPSVSAVPKVITSQIEYVGSSPQEQAFKAIDKDGQLISTVGIPSDMIKASAGNVQVFGSKIYYMSGSYAVTKVGQIDPVTHQVDVLDFTQSTKSSGGSTLYGITDWAVSDDNSEIAWIDGQGTIKVANINGSNQRTYSTDINPSPQTDLEFVDGVVYYNTGDLVQQIWRIGQDGSYSVLADDKAANTSFAVSPNNKYLAYFTWPDSTAELVVKNLITSQTYSKEIPADIIYDPIFSPDESLVAVFGHDFPNGTDTSWIMYSNSMQQAYSFSGYVYDFLSNSRLLANFNSSGIYSASLNGQGAILLSTDSFEGILDG